MIFVPILLLNMLIAMMGNTYVTVIEQSEKEWMKQWAKIVVTLERAVPQADAKGYLEAYSIPLGPADDTGFEVRGVMVIKSKSKTRAKQRKGAVSNWKVRERESVANLLEKSKWVFPLQRVGRVTLTALKKRGMTGEEMRRLMWGRASISSPVKVTKQKLKDPYNLHTESDFTNAMDMLTFANNPSASNGVQLRTPPAVAVPDPFRELILMSDQRPDTHDPHYFAGLQQLANKAFDLVEQTLKTQPQLAKKISAPAPVAATSVPALATPAPPGAAAASAAASASASAVPVPSTLTNLFQDPKDIVDPKKLEEFMNMLAEVETEESDSGGPILGKLSLAKRTHNALSKADIKRPPNFEGQPLATSSVWEQQLPELDMEPVSWNWQDWQSFPLVTIPPIAGLQL